MILIRRLRPDDDLAVVLRLCKDFFAEYEEHHEEFFDTDNLTDADMSGRFAESLDSNTSSTLVALIDDAVVGYASLVIRDQPRFYKVKTIGAISALMVTEEHRRKGVATALLSEAKSWFGKQGVKYFTFYTSVANKDAIRLYEKRGMEPLHMSFLGKS